MKFMRKGLAVLLSALLLISTITLVSAEESEEPDITVDSQQPTDGNPSSDEGYEAGDGQNDPVYEASDLEGDEAGDGQNDPVDEASDLEGDGAGNGQNDPVDNPSFEGDGDGNVPDVPVDDPSSNGDGDPTNTISFFDNEDSTFSFPVPGAESEVTEATDEVWFNTGSGARRVVNRDTSVDGDGTGDDYFDENGNYTIEIPEQDPFFPYEVQFITHEGEVSNQWFDNPGDSVEVGGHTFTVKAEFTGTAVTQMSLNVAGDTVIVYPEEKFPDGGGITTFSLLPLKEDSFSVDLTGYTPVELTMVSVSTVFGDRVADDTYDVVWKYSGDDYTISSSGDKLDLSMYTYSGGSTDWEMIVGAADQLAADNTRYIVSVKVTPSQKWLIPTVYTEDFDKTRTKTSVSESDSDYYDYNKASRYLDIIAPSSKMVHGFQNYLSLAINPSVFNSTNFSTLKAYEGQFKTAVEAENAAKDKPEIDITNQLFCTDMTQDGAGFTSNLVWVTMVTYDADGNVTGCLPFFITFFFTDNLNYVSVDYSLYEKNGSNYSYVEDTRTSTTVDGCINYTYTLYEGYPANGTYYLSMTYYKEGDSTSGSSEITAAYAGDYSSIADATSKNAQDIKDSLFKRAYYSDGGHAADYSEGVYFTIFVGDDDNDNQEIYRYCIKTVEGTTPKNTLNSGTSLYLNTLNDSNGDRIPFYDVSDGNGNDSYADNNYLTLLVGDKVDLTNVALIFSTSSGATVYVDGVKEENGKYRDFSKSSEKAIQYRVVSEDGNNSRNYWVQIVKAYEGAGILYINSFADEEADYKIVDDVQYATREVMMDSYHSNKHDILLANMGTEEIPSLSVELDEEARKTLVLDDYWTLSGDYDLPGFDGVDDTISDHGELWNLAMIRLRASEQAGTSAAIDGTLTIKSGDKTLIVLTLTGMVGYPDITTEQDNIIDAVKYVPYGTVIQDNNKYSWNKTSYSLVDGELPEGMEVRPSGEIYGVPKETGETGEFTFTVRMTNSDTSHGFVDRERTYTLTVLDNTDENVENANDESYGVKEYVEDITMSSSGEQTLVAEGEFGEFQYLYLDGERLTRDVDFTAESGSTRITISNQTLAVSAGTHTLGIEFRTTDEDLLRRAAQNYEVKDKQSSSDSNSDSSGSGSGSNSGSGSSTGSGSGSTGNSGNGGGVSNSGNSSTSTSGTASGSSSNASAGSSAASTGNTGSSNTVLNTVDSVTEVVVYTVVSGDTLWKIAEKYYGSGAYWAKIYADNADTISNPDRIYVGQKINIYLVQDITKVTGATNATSTEGTNYTVVSGDNLYKIAQKFYGKGRQWKKIYNANKDIISDPERIYAGQVIFIPEE